MARAMLGTVGFVSLGCAKNLIDSETMLGRLAEAGFALTGDHDNADVVVINTCGFLEAAREEAIDTIRHSIERKAEGHVQRVVVAGCMVANYKDQLIDAVPQVDALLSVNDREQLGAVLNELKVSGDSVRSQRISDPDARGTVYDDRGRLRLTPRHYAYLRISEGCDHTCSFCVIPSIRGKHRSKTIENIVAEATELCADGARELNIVAQDSTFYGVDICGEKSLARLLRELNRAVGDKVWIRVMYAYPNQVTDDLVSAMAELPGVLPYLDMPLQHVNGPLLARMRRGGNRELMEKWVTRFRAAMPNFRLRTTFIAGFPGETEEAHQELVQWVRDGWADRVGCFAFSPEPGSHAMTLDGHLPEVVRIARQNAVMEAASERLFDANKALVGTTLSAMVDGESQDPKYPVAARSYADAPEVDCMTYVRSTRPLTSGDVVQVKVLESLGYDLLGEVV